LPPQSGDRSRFAPNLKASGLLYSRAMTRPLIHEVLPVGILHCNCSILGDPETGEAIVVDPGDDTERIGEILRLHEWKVRAILSTHTHIDHVGGLAALHRATKAPVLIHEADLSLYKRMEMQARFLGVPTPELMAIRDFVKEGDSVRWGGYAAHVLHTPGHTPGSISLLIEDARQIAPTTGPDLANQDSHARHSTPDPPVPNVHLPARLLAGDTLFQGSIGRTDLWGGSLDDILKSIHGKLMALPDDVAVYPGHGDPTTIGAEREGNPFLR
jgi:hydroxyacylglutathione hydrolase